MARKPRDTGGEERKPPVYTRRFFTGSGTVECAVWQSPGESEEDRPRFSITVSRTYKDEQGEYRRSDTFWPQDLPALALAVQDAALHIADRMAKRQA